MIPEVNIMKRKASIASANKAAGSGGALSLPPLVGVLRKFLGSKENLDCLKTFKFS